MKTQLQNHIYISACECNMDGSLHTVCNHETGQCDCKSGVGTRVCSECLAGYYGYFNNSFDGKQALTENFSSRLDILLLIFTNLVQRQSDSFVCFRLYAMRM